MWEWLGKLAVLFAVVGGVYGFYARFLKPRALKTKLQKVTHMITDWYDEIDRNLEAGLNMAALYNKEEKILDFIKRNLKTYWIKPSPAIIRKWNQEMGFKKEYWDSVDLFQKYSRISPEGLPMDLFFSMLVGNFVRFHKQYLSKPPGKYNYAEISMPIKFPKFYLEELGYGE